MYIMFPMFSLCTEFTVSGICLLQALCPALSCVTIFIFNTFVTSDSMYIVMIIEKEIEKITKNPIKEELMSLLMSLGKLTLS